MHQTGVCPDACALGRLVDCAHWTAALVHAVSGVEETFTKLASADRAKAKLLRTQGRWLPANALVHFRTANRWAMR